MAFLRVHEALKMATPAHENPFRTSRLQSLPAEWTDATPDSLIDRWRNAGRRGALLGPHGTGKTTRLRALAEHLSRTEGWRALWICFRDDGTASPEDWREQVRASDERSLLCIDGLESLGWPARLELRFRARRAGGAMATLHKPRAGWPALCRHAPDAALFVRHAIRLAPDLPESAARAAFAAARGNAHEAFRRLYLAAGA